MPERANPKCNEFKAAMEVSKNLCETMKHLHILKSEWPNTKQLQAQFLFAGVCPSPAFVAFSLFFVNRISLVWPELIKKKCHS